MTLVNESVDLKQVLGAMIFGVNRPLSVKEMRKCLTEAAALDEKARVFEGVQTGNIEKALQELQADLDKQRCGFHLKEVAGGYILQSDAACGLWLKHILQAGRPHRLSRPALETLAIIAYKQPLTRADIERIRGVNVDHIIKTLLEMQLIRIVGRSELPGRPFTYGTTQFFLEHFGLRDLKELEEIGPAMLAQREIMMERAQAVRPSPETETDQASKGMSDSITEEGDELKNEDDELDEGLGGDEYVDEDDEEEFDDDEEEDDIEDDNEEDD